MTTTPVLAPSSQPNQAADLSAAASIPPQPRAGVFRRALRGNTADPKWVRPALLILLATTAVLYLWNLGASGWANSFYSAAVQAGSVDWQAFFYGSSDAANSITVDKTPASLWVMALSVRVFGLNSWSILVPQALMGVATVGLLYATVRRAMNNRTLARTSPDSNDDAVEPAASWVAPAAGLLAGVVMALTPVAVLMFKFNNPDALLVLLLVGAVYAFTRACEKASTWWLVAVGTLIGFGFLTKMLQALLIVPVLAIVYLIVAPNRFRTRILQLLAAGLALVASAGWWVAIVELTPADMRPYIGGSQNNSVMELVLGYNGLGRLTGDEVGSVVPGGGTGGPTGGGSMWGETGIGRMFNAEIGGQVAWLIPAAILLGLAGLWLTRRAARTDSTRTALLVWGGWLAATMLTFSFMQGIFHAYYTVALAPAIGAVVGIGAVLLWEHRAAVWAGAALAVTMLVTAGWAYVLLGRSAEFVPWLAPLVLFIGFVVALALVAVSYLPGRVAAAVAIAAMIVALAGPTAYAVQTTTTAHSGSIPTAGPQVAGGMGGPGGMRGPGGRDGQPGTRGLQPGTGTGTQQFAPPGGFPGGAQGATPPGQGTAGQGMTGQGAGQGAGQGGPGGAGGLLNGSNPSAAVTSLLQQNASDYTWVAAAIGSQNASGYQLASQEPVMAIGGFNGSDPSPTLAQFQQLVKEGKIHYFIGGNGAGPGGGAGTSSQISAWVTENFTAQAVDGTTLYDLSSGTS